MFRKELNTRSNRRGKTGTHEWKHGVCVFVFFFVLRAGVDTLLVEGFVVYCVSRAVIAHMVTADDLPPPPSD